VTNETLEGSFVDTLPLFQLCKTRFVTGVALGGLALDSLALDALALGGLALDALALGGPALDGSFLSFLLVVLLCDESAFELGTFKGSDFCRVNLRGRSFLGGSFLNFSEFCGGSIVG
jgi:hypothetical protein